MDDMGRWIDREHAAHPRKMGISEYGAACSIPAGRLAEASGTVGQWHPENWQTYYHGELETASQEREFLWCNFIWCMFDFSAAGRREDPLWDATIRAGDLRPENKERCLYFYKANWNQEDKFVYISQENDW